MITVEQYNEALKIVRKYKKQGTSFIKAVPLQLYPNYFADKQGNIYNNKGTIINKVRYSKTGRPQLVCNINKKKIGIATIIATQFIDNPKDYTRCIFKDNNPLNCSVDNIAWVSNEIVYIQTKINHPDTSPMGKNGKKAETVDRLTAIMKSKDTDLHRYYTTGNEDVLNELWLKIDAEVKFRDWDKVKTEIYIYFIDRCKRRSLFGNPYAYIISLAQIKIRAYRKSLNTSLAKESKKIDEELIRLW